MSRDRRNWGIVHDPVSVFVALYVVALLLGAGVAVGRGTSPPNIASGLRPQLFAASFLVYRYALSSPVWRKRLVVLVSGLTLLVALMQGLQVALGPGAALFAVGSYTDLIELDAATGFLRVRPPGLYLEYVVACMSAAYAVWGPREQRIWALIVFAAAFSGTLLSFNRNMVVGLVAGLAAAGVFSLRKRRLVIGAVVLAAMLLVGVAYTGGGSSSGPVVQRFVSLADPAARSAALEDRRYENGLALAAIARSPVFGIGWGTEYGATAVRVFEGIVAGRNRDWIHNQYLASWMRMGILGLVAFVGLISGTVYGGVRAGRLGEPNEATWLAPATIAAMIALATSATVDLVILSPSNLPVLMLVAAIGSFLWAEGRVAGKVVSP
jgi:O-antigen ligase